MAVSLKPSQDVGARNSEKEESFPGVAFKIVIQNSEATKR